MSFTGDIGSKAAHNPSDFLSLSNQAVKIIFGDITHIKRNIELGPYLRAGCARDHQKLMKLSRVIAFKTFCNIRHNGYGSPLNLS